MKFKLQDDSVKNVPFYADVKIECVVDSSSLVDGKILTNVAEITNYGYHLGDDFIDAREKDVDIDSEQGNVFNIDPNVKSVEDYLSYQTDVESGEDYSEYQRAMENKNEYVGIQDDDDFENIRVQPFDLALRKFITKVESDDGTVTTPENREPMIDSNSKNALKKNGTAIYYHNKTPITVKTGDKVTYAIRVYNEGYTAGFAKEITDYLPKGLEFDENSDINKQNGWIATKNKDDGTTTVKTEILKDVEIKASNGWDGYGRIQLGIEQEVDFYKDIYIECRVTSTEKDQILTNVAEITSYGYNGNDNNFVFADQKGIDQDSEQDTIKDVIKNTSEYFDLKGVDDINNTETIFYNSTHELIEVQNIPGIQDDDDFENVKVQPDLKKFKFVLNKVDEKGNPLIGADFTVKREKDGTSEVLLDNKEVKGTYEVLEDEVQVNKTYTYRVIEVESAPEYVNVMEGKYITLRVYMNGQKKLVLGNYEKVEEEEDLINKYGFIINNENGTIVKENETDLYEKIKVKVSNQENPAKVEITIPNAEVQKDFDLALRKFITAVRKGVGTKNETKEEITSRIPVFKVDEDGSYIYEHEKENPVVVGNQNIVEYTIRVYNEGTVNGYAKELKDDIPDGLEFLPNDEVNKQYGWVMVDEEGNIVEDVNEAKYIVTDYLSKEKEQTEGENLLKAFDVEEYKAGTITEPDHKEVKVAFKVTIPNSDNRILINQAQISDDSDEDGNDVIDKDSTPDKWIEGEDDQDIEKVKVLEFDLALRKWVTKAIVIENGKETVQETGHTAEDDPEDIVKVDLKKSAIKNVVVKYEYKIRVTNEGEIAGYAKEISDYIPEGLRFEAADNPLWKESEGKVTTDQLKDTLLQPGESAEATIILTWINREDNMGLKVNVAEISKDYNEYGTPDRDSVPNNQVPGEDDIDDAPIMLTVKTGQEILYVGITAVVLNILCAGIVLIKKFALR